jgi:hypothetical protein
MANLSSHNGGDGALTMSKAKASFSGYGKECDSAAHKSVFRSLYRRTKYGKTVLTVEPPTMEGVSRTGAKCRCAPRASSTNDHDAGEVVNPVRDPFQPTDDPKPAESDQMMERKGCK